ncbi:MAG: hypothetical protein AB7K52_13625 [Phycisphaerales bacterium]
MSTRANVVLSVVPVALFALAGTAHAQPANNACAQATPLTLTAEGTTAVLGTTIGATNDSASGNCPTSNASPDVWYTVVAPGTGVCTLNFDTCSAGTDFNTTITVRAGTTCPGSTLVYGCNDDDNACGEGRSRLSFLANGGSTYRVRIAGANGATGNFALKVGHNRAPRPVLGPDVITNVITDIMRFGTGTSNGMPVTAYAVGTDSCNKGDYPVLWIDNSNYTPDYNVTMHPVIGQNIYRLKNYGGYSRFEHLGQSWLKHGFVSTNSAGCGGCAPNSTQLWRPSTQNYQSVGGDVLGVNCSDTYGASLNGSQSTQGSKNIVHPTLGTSPFLRNNGTGEATIRQRLQIPTSDVTGQPAGTRYFAEAHYITADDAQFVRPGETVAYNALNNNSWREISAGTINNSSPSLSGATVQMQPAIFAWRIADPGVTLVSADHDDMPNPSTGFRLPNGQPQYPGDKFVRSRFWIAAKVTDLGDGTWRYEYAVYNQNSDRSAGSFSIPFPEAIEAPASFTFHAPLWHSGEPYSNTPWTMTKSGGRLTFSTQSFAANPNASAIRWDTLYNFGFTASIPPTTGSGSIELFKPGASPCAPGSISVANLPVPTAPPPCAADFNQDGNVDPDDLGDFVDCYFAVPACQGADFNADCILNADDLGDFINSFFTPCN